MRDEIELRYKIALNAINRAGVYLRQMLNKPVSIKEKGRSSLVSDADIGAEEIIVSAIEKKFPEDNILTEESKEKKTGSSFRWIIDPLDGTHSFLSGYWHFGCGLALEEDGKIIFGICYFPMYNEFFSAKKGEGAFCNKKRIFVSKAKELSGQFYFQNSSLRFALKESLEDISRFISAGCRIRIYGSLHFVLSRIANGQAVVVIGRGEEPWDVAPVAIIIEEAGGLITDHAGLPWNTKRRGVIATNKLLHSEALSILNTKERGI